MCDTMAAGGQATTTGFTLFARNGDRERNEAQFLELRPAQDCGRGAVVRTTYIAVPQAARTHAVLPSRPIQPGYRRTWQRFNRLACGEALAAE